MLVKVFLSHEAFHKMEDHLQANDAKSQKRNRFRAAELEAGLDIRQDVYAPYSTGIDDGGLLPAWATTIHSAIRRNSFLW